MYAHYKCIRIYKEVHKKLCIPLPGLFQRGRLYKTQSCGSLVREKINTSTTTANNTELKQYPIMTTSTIVTHQQNSKSSSTLLEQQQKQQQQTNSKHSTVLFVEKGKILRSRLSGKFLGNSDGDINQNENENDENNHHISMIKTKSANTLVSNNYHNIDKAAAAAAATTTKKRNSISTDSYCSNYISNDSNKNITKDNEILMTKQIAATETASLLKQFYSTIATASTSSLSSIGSNNKLPGIETTATLTATLIASATRTATATALSLPTAKQIKLNCCQLLPNDKNKLNDDNDENLSSKSYNNDDNDDDDVNDAIKNDRTASRGSNNDEESLTNSSLHQLNDVPLCSSKC